MPETSSGEEASGGVGTLHTPVLETPVAGPRAGVRPRVMDGAGGKAGNRNDEEEDARLGMGIYKGTDGGVGSSNEERVGEREIWSTHYGGV